MTVAGGVRQLVAADRMLVGAVDPRLALRPAGHQAGEQAADHRKGGAERRGEGARRATDAARRTGADVTTRPRRRPRRHRPGARPSSVHGPTAHRTSRSVGNPTAAVIRRTWRLRPSARMISSHAVGIARADADRRVAGPQSGRLGDFPAVTGRVTKSAEVDASPQRRERRRAGRRPRPAPSRSCASLCRGEAMRACSAPSAVRTTRPSLSASRRPAG